MSSSKGAHAPALWLLLLLAGLPQVAETIYSPALPNIAASLHTTNALTQWTLSIYLAGFALGVFLWGRFSDHYGRRPAMLLGLTIYALASTCCLFTPTITWLLASRLFQGFGISVGSVIVQAMAREALSDEGRHKFFSSIGFVMAFSIALGPFVGGYLTQWFQWRANFSMLLSLGSFCLLVSVFALPETRPSERTQKKKISEVARMLLKDKYVVGACWMVAVVNGFLFSYYAEGPFIFIETLHLTPGQFGWLGSTVALAALLGSLSSKSLGKRYNHHSLIGVGALIILASTIVLVIVSQLPWMGSKHQVLSSLFLVLPVMGITYGGFGFVIPMTLSNALQKYKDVMGTAGALFGLSYYVVISSLTWLMGYFHNGTLTPMPLYFFVLAVITLGVHLFFIREKPTN